MYIMTIAQPAGLLILSLPVFPFSRHVAEYAPLPEALLLPEHPDAVEDCEHERDQ